MESLELEKMANLNGGGKNANCRFLGGVWIGGLLSTFVTGGAGFGIATGAWAGAKVYGCFD